jgi:hypothetical protein
MSKSQIIHTNICQEQTHKLIFAKAANDAKRLCGYVENT